MDKFEWEVKLEQIADEAAKERQKLHESGYMPQVLKTMDVDDFKAEFKQTLKEKFGDYDKLDDEDRRVISTYPTSDMTNFLMGAGRNPLDKAWEEKFDKFQALLDDNTNRELGQPNWTNMNDLDLKTKAKELGYNLNKVEDRGEFFKKLAEFQTAYERGMAADNMGESGWGKFNALVNPASYEEAQRQAITGEGTEAQLYNTAALDMLANTALWELPGAKGALFGKMNPIAATSTDAILQGAAEALRQGGKVYTDPNLGVSLPAVTTAAALGATRPGMMLAAQGYLSRFQGAPARSFARGVAKSTRSGDPRTYERAGLENAIDQNYANIYNRSTAILDDSPITTIKPNMLGKVELGDKAKDKLEALAVNNQQMKSEKILENMLADKEFQNTLSRADMKKLGELEDRVNNPSWTPLNNLTDAEIHALTDKLNRIQTGAGSQHDKVVAKAMALADATGAINSKEVMDLGRKYYAYRTKKDALKAYDAEFVPEFDPKTGKLTPKSQAQWDKLEKEFPAKMLDEKDANVYSDAGMKAGTILAGFGSRFEPTFKWNPFSVITSSHDPLKPIVSTDYKETDWYNAMDPEQRAAFEKAVSDMVKSRRK